VAVGKESDVLAEMDRLQAEASEKVSRAMHLFSQVDDTYKRVALLGWSGPKTPRGIRDYFDILDLMDELDNLIFDLEYEIESGTGER
jgi:hypothetical protein